MKRKIFISIVLLTVLVLGLSYGAFIYSTDKYTVSDLLVTKLNYTIDIEEDKTSITTIDANQVNVPSNSKVYLNITLTSINKIDSKYTLAYKTTSNAKVMYSDRTQWNTSGVIKGLSSNTYSKKIRVVIDNSGEDTNSIVSFQVYGGYSFNTFANISLKDGYVTLNTSYTEELGNIGNRLVDIVESDTNCITSEESTCMYGGENKKNYVQYPTNEDKTKNLWRIIGNYQIDNETLPKLISETTTSTSTSTLTTDLTNFYNTLEDKEVLIKETKKFSCFTSNCTESTYSNIGLLTDYEYNLIGGKNSYLSTTENYIINTQSGLKEVTQSGINNSPNTSGLKPTIYLQTGVQVTGSGTINDPYTISPASDINLVAYTLNGNSTDKTYAELLKTNVVNNVTCKNGTVATWDNTDFSIKLKSIKTPDYCTIDFKEGYTITLTATNGTVSAPTSKTTGYNQSVSFTITPSSGYLSQLETNSCGGTLSGSTYTVTNVTGNRTCGISFKEDTSTLYYHLLADKTTRPGARTDFNTTLSADNTKTLYASTENGITVYYFAGNALDNWVKFGKNSNGKDLYWRIIRTNEDGSIRLLYHSTSTTAKDSYIIEAEAFNSSNDDSMYVGYMYGTSGTLASNRTNTNNSTIKTAIDSWYAKNLTNYTKYLSTTAIYCNDREVGSGTYSATGISEFFYKAYTRLETNKTPTYNCTNDSDAFSVSNSSAKLTYPIGLMTADEISFAGGVIYTNASAYYYQNSAGNSSIGLTNWYTMSPYNWDSPRLGMFIVSGTNKPGSLLNAFVTSANAVRPVTSLKSCVKWKSGDGTPDNPYEIVETTSGC